MNKPDYHNIATLPDKTPVYLPCVLDPKPILDCTGSTWYALHLMRYVACRTFALDSRLVSDNMHFVYEDLSGEDTERKIGAIEEVLEYGGRRLLLLPAMTNYTSGEYAHLTIIHLDQESDLFNYNVTWEFNIPGPTCVIPILGKRYLSTGYAACYQALYPFTTLKEDTTPLTELINNG